MNPWALVMLAAMNTMGLCGLLVWVYNRTFSGLHESVLKKSIALGSLPLGVACGVGVAMTSGTPGGLWLNGAGFVLAAVTLTRVLKQRRCEREDARRSIRLPVNLDTKAGIAWSALGRFERVVLGLVSVVNRPTALVVKTYPVKLAGVAARDVIRIVYVSDFHIHRTLTEEYYREVVRVACSLKPDVILLGGDYVTKERHIARVGGILAGLCAPYGVFAIRGNHDFWTRPHAVAEELRKAGVRLLSQECTEVVVRGTALRIAGVESPYLPLTRPQERRLRASAPHITMVHGPDEFPTAARLGSRMAIAGHTHGGQVRLPWFGTTLSATRLGPGYAFGMNTLGGMMALVSVGAGSFVPLRVDCPPEVLLLLVSGGGDLADGLSDEPEEPSAESDEHGPL